MDSNLNPCILTCVGHALIIGEDRMRGPSVALESCFISYISGDANSDVYANKYAV